MSAADRLREAAKVLRERGEAAQVFTLTEPWQSDCEQVIGGNGGWLLVATTADGGIASEDDPAEVITESESAVAAYIATMHPGVALALADWLDARARFCEREEVPAYPDEPSSRIADLILDGPR